METGLPPPSKSRKRQSDDEADARSESHSMSGDDSSDAEGFITVESRRTRRARKSGSTRSSTTIVIPAPQKEFTVVFVPTSPASSVSKISRCQLSTFLDGIAPGKIKEVRFNSRKNVVAVDASNSATVSSLLSTPLLCGVAVRSYIPRGHNTIVGVIQDVDNDIPDSDIAAIISSTSPVIEVRRFGNSQSVKIVFLSDCLPASVKVGLVRYPVRPYVPRPLQCRNCMKLGHVAGACPSHEKCDHCGLDHKASDCTSQEPKCINCLGNHEATSKDCPRLRKELKICQRMARDNSTHKEAAAQVRKNTRRKSRSVSHRRVARSSSEQPEMPSPNAGNAQICTLAKPTAPDAYADVCKSGRRLQHKRTDPPATGPASEASTPSVTDGKIFAMLKTLISVIQGLIANRKTPAAKAASQILTTLLPVMDCLESCS